MSSIYLGIFGIVFLLVLVALGVHLAVALGVVGLLGIWSITGSWDAAIRALSTGVFSRATMYALSCIPPFILMGEFMQTSGLAARLYQAVDRWIGRMPGSMGITTVITNAFFGAACGSSFVAVAVFTKIGFKPMLDLGYDKRLAGGTIVAASNLSMLIPPSILMVVYGSITELSIGNLLLAGIGPGVLLILLYSAYCIYRALRHPEQAPRSAMRYSMKEKLATSGPILIVLLLGVIFIGGIYTGFFTPTEAGAVGSVVTFVFCIRGLSVKKVVAALKETLRSSAMLFVIIICAGLFSRFLVLSQLTVHFTAWIVSLSVPAIVILLMFMLIYLVLGCLMDPQSIMFITLPIMYPIMTQLGFNPFWAAICLIVTLEVGFMTPPVGLTVYGFKAAAGDGVTIVEAFQGVIPYLILTVIAMFLVLLFPVISTFLIG